MPCVVIRIAIVENTMNKLLSARCIIVDWMKILAIMPTISTTNKTYTFETHPFYSQLGELGDIEIPDSDIY